MGEFDIIEQYFNRQHPQNNALLSIGDDCALLNVPTEQQLAITTDTLVVNNHFLPNIDPADLAYKAVAVNLSDLAAMGATPKWISLALTLPHIDCAWLKAFSDSLFAILDQHQVQLIGGDTTRGDYSITITAQGLITKGKGLFRHKAKVGDYLYVSGYLGDSAGGLELLLNDKIAFNAAEQYLLARHLRPTPRVALGLALRDYADCAIDLSDGLLPDLGHILKRSQCGAEIFVENLPISAELANIYPQKAEEFALIGGENYELCFTVRPEKCAEMEAVLTVQNLPYYRIGRITASGLKLTKNNQSYPLPTSVGFQHFNA